MCVWAVYLFYPMIKGLLSSTYRAPSPAHTERPFYIPFHPHTPYLMTGLPRDAMCVSDLVCECVYACMRMHMCVFPCVHTLHSVYSWVCVSVIGQVQPGIKWLNRSSWVDINACREPHRTFHFWRRDSSLVKASSQPLTLVAITIWEGAEGKISNREREGKMEESRDGVIERCRGARRGRERKRDNRKRER